MSEISIGLIEMSMLLSSPLLSSSLDVTLTAAVNVSLLFAVAYNVTAFSLPAAILEMFQTPFPI